MRAADDDRHVRPVVLDAPRDLDGARILDRHARDPDEIRPTVPHPRDDLVDSQMVELPVEQLDLVARRPQRARDVGDPQSGEPRPVPVELTARRRLDERDPHGIAYTKKPRRPREANSTREKPASMSIPSATGSV